MSEAQIRDNQQKRADGAEDEQIYIADWQIDDRVDDK